MRHYSKLFKRVQAWVLTIAMILPVLNTGLLLGVSAEEKTPQTLTDGQIVAENYEMTDEEKALVSSGLLVGETHSIYYPTANDDLVTVDEENKVIKADSYTDDGGYIWVPVSADIVVNGITEKTVQFVDGKASYDYDGNAFAVKVLYRLYIEIADATQESLLNAAGYLKQGLVNMNTISSSTGTNGLTALEAALPKVLLQLANGISMNMGSFSVNAQFGDAAKNAVKALNEQYKNNGNKLVLHVIATDYSNAASKVQYICNHDVYETFMETYNCIQAIKDDPLMNNALLDGYLQGADPANHTLWMALKNIIGGWLDAMAPVAEDAWALESTKVVQDGLNDVQWANMDSLVAAIDTVSENVVKNPLVVAETTIQVNMSMFNVKVNVELKVAGSDASALVAKDMKSTVITLKEGASKAEVLAAVLENGLESAAKAEWAANGLYVDGHFEVATSTLPGALTEDTVYTITYSPKYYTITYAYDNPTTPVSAPYGYQLILPECATAGKVYDYTVNGANFYEGAVITITDNTSISRVIGKAYDLSMSLNKVVSNVYFGSNAEASAILNSGALNVGNEMLNIRTPEGTLSIENDILTAKSYASNYAGLIWVPTAYTLVGGADNGVTGTISAGQADLSGKSYEQVSVSYKLALTNFTNNDVLNLVNLPYYLYDEAEGQLSVLNRLAGHADNMGMIGMIGMLESVLDTITLNPDPDKDAAIKEEYHAVIAGIQADCMNGQTLKLKTLIDGYKAGGLGYYYRNSDAFARELDLLSGYLTRLVGGENKDDKVAALTVLLDTFADMVPQLKGKEAVIVNLESEMAELKAELKAPHAAINVSSKNLDTLAAALTLTAGQAANLKKYNTLPEEFALYRTVSVEASGKESAKITLYAPDGEKIVITKVYDQGYVLTAGDIATIKAEVVAAVNTLNLSESFYSTNYDVDQLLVGFAGKRASEINLEYEWTAKTFTVKVPGFSDQIISVDDLTIDLPASSTFGIRYEYTIGSKSGLTGTYTFTLAEIQSLFVDGSYSVARTEIDENQEALIAYVNGLNDAIDGSAVKFALVKGAQGYTIIMKLDASQPGALAGAMQGMAMGFVQSGYTYIGLDEYGVLENNQVSLQAIINAIMASGFSTQDLIAAMDSNGAIRNMTMPGEVLAGGMTTAGGKLIATTMSIGSAKNNAQKVGFYITLGAAAGEILQARNLLAGQLNNYMKFVCVDGKATVQMTLPEKAYEAYLAALLVTNNLDIRDIHAANGEIAIGFVKDFINPLFVGDVTLETVNNTLNAFGYNMELSAYEDLYAKLCDQYEKTEVLYDEKSGYATRSFSIKALIDAMNIPSSLAGMIKEYETGITVTAAVCLENLDNEYDALYVDVRASGVTNKIGLTKDLSSKLKGLSGASIIVLLDDVDGDLVIPYTTVLNLNGFTVNGSIKSTGTLTIVDSSILVDDIGNVTGTVSGDVTILGGQYNADIAAFLKPGYVKDENGVVGNEFFSFVKDANGDITIQIDAGIAATDSLPDLKSMVIDLAVDMLFNGYTTNKLYINNHMVYEMVMDDFVGIYTGENRLNTLVHNVVNMVNSQDLAAIVNQLSEDLTDFGALQNAIANDQPVLSYPMTTGSWDVVLEHVTDGDYLTISVASGNIKNRNLHVKFVGSEEDKALLADLMGALKDTTDVDIKVDLDHGFASSADKNLVLDWGASAKINIDFSNNYDYAVMFSIILANKATGSLREDLVNGIKTYYATGEIVDLRVAFDSATTSQAIAAMKGIYKNSSFTDMIAALGLTDVVTDDVVDLENIFDNYAKLLAAVVRKVDVVGGDRTLGSFYNSTLKGYGFSKSNLDKTFARELFKGYSVTLNVDISEVTVVIDIFGDTAPYVVDYTELENVINQANGLNASDYALNTWNAMQEVLASAEALLNNATKQAQVDNMVNALNDAINALIDVTALKAAIAQAESLNPSDYTVDSWNALLAVLEDARALVNDAPDQATVNETAADLTVAIRDLDPVQIPDVEELDYSVLTALIAQVEGLNPADYTEISWNYLWSVYLEAVALVDNADTQDEIDAMAAELALAIADLVPATIDDVTITEDHDGIADIILMDDNVHIVIDAHSQGLNADELLAILSVSGNANYRFEVESIQQNAAGLVYTGARVVVNIYNGDHYLGSREFILVVLGDIDSDGRATSRDANLMAAYYTGLYSHNMDEHHRLACDINQDGEINARDALIVSYKYVNWNEYKDLANA